MSLVKKMRKNRTKIMVGLVAFLMVAFVLGASLPAMFRSISKWMHDRTPVAKYDGNVIRNRDMLKARQDIQVLKELMADRYLAFATTPAGMPDFKARFLGQILFPDSELENYVNAQLKQSATQGMLQVSQTEIDDFFLQIKGRGEINWLLLNSEAKNAGIAISNNSAKQIIKQIISGISQGKGDAAVVVNNISRKFQLQEHEIISVFAELVGLLSYAESIANSEDITINQLRSLIGLGQETISSEFVKFEVNRFDPNLPEPTNAEIQEHFEKYKTFKDGEISEENPYGFGYAQPATAELEYFIIKLDDVKSTVIPPTEQEVEDYYTMNSQNFTEDIPVDPNEPDGEKTTRTKEYIEVASQIRNTLMTERTEIKADMIISDALVMLEKGLADLDIEKMTSDLYKENATDFTAVAEKIADKYGVEVFTGRTGKLSQSGLVSDMNLGMLIKESGTGQPVPLDRIVFSIDELGETKLGKFETLTPKMWQLIGPVKHRIGTMSALVRIVGANKPSVAESPDLTYSRKGADLDMPTIKSEGEYNLKNEVIEDLKLVKGMEIARQKAEEFAKLLKDKTWDEAIEEFNKSNTDTAVRRIRLSKQTDKARGTLMDKKIAEIISAGSTSPSIEYHIRRNASDKMLQEKLFDMVPSGEKKIEDSRQIFAFEPEGGYYVIKDIAIADVTDEDYAKAKITTSYMGNLARVNSLMPVHFSPNNIKERMNFEWAADKTATEKIENADDGRDGSSNQESRE